MGAVSSSASECLSAFWVAFNRNGGSSSHPSQVTVNGTTYRLEGVIGEGGYGYVYSSTSLSSGERFAVKRFNVHEPEQQERFLEEGRIQQRLTPHANIVPYVASEVVERRGVPLPEIYLVMELCPGPSLEALVNDRRAKSRDVPLREALDILAQTAAALAHMHSQSPPVAHFDVKLGNVLQCVGSDGAPRYKLIDFGSASALSYQCRTAAEVTVAEGELASRMTLLYRPPESLDLWLRKAVSTKADVWSLGVMAYALVFLEYPFDENPLEIIAAIPKHFRAGDSAPVKDGFGPLVELIRTSMLVADPDARADIFTVAEKIAQLRVDTGETDVPPPPARPRPGMQSAQKKRFP